MRLFQSNGAEMYWMEEHDAKMEERTDGRMDYMLLYASHKYLWLGLQLLGIVLVFIRPHMYNG